MQLPNCILDDRALRPGVRPFPEYVVLLGAVFETCNKAAFCQCVIARQQKRKLIKTIHFLSENTTKLLSRRVLQRSLLALFNSVQVIHRDAIAHEAIQSWPESCAVSQSSQSHLAPDHFHLADRGLLP